MERRRALVATITLTISMLASTADAQLFDHLKCYKIKDSAKFAATADLEALQAEFGVEDCVIKGKGKLFCVMVDKDVMTFEDKTKPPLVQPSFDGQELSDDRICYKIKCPKVTIAPQEVGDQFGVRTVEKFKATMLCTPAFKGPAPSGDPNGTACSDGTSCASGFCADGFCCDTACSGSCDACDTGGNEGACTIVTAGSPGSPSCSPFVCNGSGSACPASCSSDGDCVATHYCSGGACLLKGDLGDACAAPNQCTSDACATDDGVCCNTACSGLCEACVASNTGGTTGICSFVSAGTDPDGECGLDTCDGTGACAP